MPKILVIEDDADMVTALRMPLEATGYEVVAAATGEEGLQKVKEEGPDLIILDVMMETTTAGFQVSLELRSPLDSLCELEMAGRYSLRGIDGISEPRNGRAVHER